jgi:hypothetical protein
MRLLLKIFRIIKELLKVRYFPTLLLHNNYSLKINDEIKGILILADIRLFVFLSHSSNFFQTLESVIFGCLKTEKREIITKPPERFYV